MFFVEKKFTINKGQKGQLLKKATFLNEEKFTDTYYDNDKLSLAVNDLWLKKHGDNFILKLPANQFGKEKSYQEIEGEMTIREIFAIPLLKTFEEDLQSFGHKPFCSLEIEMKKYAVGELEFSILKVHCGDWEEELLKIKIDENQAAKNSLIDRLVADFKLRESADEITDFLKTKKPDLYQILVDAGLF